MLRSKESRHKRNDEFHFLKIFYIELFQNILQYLSTKEDDSEDTNPTVETVHVGDVAVIVETEDSHQTNNHKHQSQSMQTSMDKLDSELRRVSKHTICNSS